jgi:hypothetical protein
MGWFKQSYEQSMLGQILVRQNLVSEQQLAQAIEQQKKTGARLGDILAEWNVVTQKHVEAALRKQRNLRMTASIVAALLAPVEAFAVAPAPIQQISAATESRGGLQPMTEEDLDSMSAQGLSEQLTRRIAEHNAKGADGVAALGQMAQAFNPLLGFLQADVSVKNVVYDPVNATSIVNSDGSITLSMPSTIGELNIENIRVRGSAPDAPSFGSITMRDIDLRGTTVTLKPH